MKININPRIDVTLIDDDDMVVSMFRRERKFEPEALAAWADLCIPGSTVVDVGAYTGIYSIAACHAGAQPVAYEPHFKNANRLMENAAINGLGEDRIALRRVLAGDRSEDVDFHFNHQMEMTSGGSIQRGSMRGAIARLPMRRLDDDIPAQEIRAIKIDVEGAEELVIAGAMRVISCWRPTMIVELLHEELVDKFLALLPIPYRYERLDDRNWMFVR